MTVHSDEDSPKKAVPGHGRKRERSKRTMCAWVLVVLVPFLLVKLVFFYASPFLLFSPSAQRSEAELMNELEFPTPSGRDEELRTASRNNSKFDVRPDPSSDLPVEEETESTITDPEAPPTEIPEEEVDEKEEVKTEDISPQPPRLNGDEEQLPPEETTAEQEQEEQVVNQEDASKKEESLSVEQVVDDKQPIEQVTSSNASALAPAESQGCNLYDGDWVHDPEGPLYTNRTCFYIQSMQNCMSNGRPDTAYMYWKWKPRHCDLPRFDAKGFLEMFRGKTIGFVGDSLSRNQMQSLLCMLSQLEIPDQIYQSADDKSVRWLFKSYQVTLATVWSPYLLKETTGELKGIEEGQSKLFTDSLDEGWTSVMNDFDVMVLSIGQWYFKPSVYIQNDEVIGCHYCPGLNLTEIGFYHAYKSAVRHVLDKVTKDYKGLAIMSTFALDHFENGSWSNGGSCTREQPLKEGEKLLEGMNYEMHQIVVEEYESTVQRRKRNRKKVQVGLLDVTLLSLLRADGHPGPFRVSHPYDGIEPGTLVQNDCLHWCLPGPVDTWNQFLVELILSNLKK
ncbi:hypothetical protein R1flu_026922 [Riccia fluitans]|uniref:Trichome birefringence-like N-terminal domain-containing protein n=1 Tax=Riccia fluitans TaxID=41844 RepID=A0ABD1XHA8_9MARC